MLGINYQYIYCKVTKCRHNKKHVVRYGKTGKIAEVYYTCEKEKININKKGKCTEAP